MTETMPGNKKAKAMFIGTLTGWFGVGIIDYFTLLFIEGRSFEPLATLAAGLFAYTIFGLPIALILCFFIGIPVFVIFEKLRRLDKYSAIFMGAIMGTLLGAINFIIFLTAYQNFWLWLDWLSTIMVGAIAGYVSFQYTKIPQKVFVEHA